MQPFLLEFVDSKAFEIFCIGLAVTAGLSVLAVLIGVVALGLRLRNNWRWWKGLDEEAKPVITRRYFLSKAKKLVVLALLFSALETLVYLKQRSYERSPANVSQQQNRQSILRERVAGMYTLPDTLLRSDVKAAQQGQEGWSLIETGLPPATLAQLIIRREGTFSYQSKIPTDNTTSSEGIWQWQSLTGHPESLSSYGPVFYIKNNPLQDLWAVHDDGEFIFFGTYKKDEHSVPFELKRQADRSAATP